jgi:hypothetical protein
MKSRKRNRGRAAKPKSKPPPGTCGEILASSLKPDTPAVVRAWIEKLLAAPEYVLVEPKRTT